MDSKELAPGIVVYSLPDIKNLLTEVSKAVEDGVAQWEDSALYDSGLNAIIVDKTFRNCQIIKVNYSEENNSTPKEKFLYEMSKKFLEIFTPAETDYRNEFNPDIEKHANYQILKYPTGGHLSMHIDDGPGTPHRVSMLIYLNDNYEGGEIEFPRFNVKYKPKENDMILFPSTYTYNHAVSTITSGERYCIISWLN